MSEHASPHPESSVIKWNAASPNEAAGTLPPGGRLTVDTIAHSDAGFARGGSIEVTLPGESAPVDWYASLRVKTGGEGFVDIGEDPRGRIAAVEWRPGDTGRYRVAEVAPLEPGRAISLSPDDEGRVFGPPRIDRPAVGINREGALSVVRPATASQEVSIHSLGKPEDFLAPAQPVPVDNPPRHSGEPELGERAMAIDPRTGEQHRVVERPPLTAEAAARSGWAEIGTAATGDAVDATNSRPRRRRTQQRPQARYRHY